MSSQPDQAEANALSPGREQSPGDRADGGAEPAGAGPAAGADAAETEAARADAADAAQDDTRNGTEDARDGAGEAAGDAEAPAEPENAGEADTEGADAGADAAEASSDEGDEYAGEDAGDSEGEVYKLKSHRRARKEEPARPTERRRARKVRHEPEPEPEPEPELDEATKERRALEAKIDAALRPSSKKRKKLAGDDLESMQDDVIAKLRDDMRNAALEDVDSIRKGEPAIHKVRMLPDVVQVLQKGSLADSILDGNLLESVRIWLEPLPDASLPSFEIQRELFRALIALPIKTIHLRESGLGRVVLFYQKSKRPQPAIKRMAQKLIGDWTRPIIGRSDNYRDKRVATADFDPRETRFVGASGASTGPRSSYEEAAARRNRAAIPSSSGISYQVAPVSEAQTSSGSGPTSKDSQLRRMKTKLMASGRGSRKKSQVSVEGRGLN